MCWPSRGRQSPIADLFFVCFEQATGLPVSDFSMMIALRKFGGALRSLFVATILLGSGVAGAAETPAETSSPRLLKKIMITEGLEAAQALVPDPSDRLVVLAPSVSFLDEGVMTTRLAAAQGRPIDDRLLAAIAQVVENSARQRDYPVATAIVPPQSIADGTVRVALLMGKVRQIKVEGNRWFSDSLLREKLRLQSGGILRVSELDQAINWTNTNPFRQVKVHIEPVAGGTGEADVFIRVAERLPLRLQATVDNSGIDLLGENRLSAAMTYANVWGLDHRATYQYLTSDEWEVFQGHSFDYQVPLPWRHGLQFAASYVRATPTLVAGFIDQKGESVTADLKYIAPFNPGKWRAEGYLNFGFKQTNNNLIFLGEPVPFSTTDIFTVALGATAVRADKRGNWIVSATVTGSPGNLNSRNTDEAYHDSRIFAKARFIHSQLSVQRWTQLTPKVTALTRAALQFASTNLLAPEQFSIGGHTSVRGYTDRLLSGDGGYMFSQELHHPGPTLKLGKRLPAMATSGVAFWEYGRVIVKQPFGTGAKNAGLASCGLGVRFSMGNLLSGAVDYGAPLVDMPGESGRLHFRVSLSY